MTDAAARPSCGIGWRHPHYAELLQRAAAGPHGDAAAIDFVEVHSENFFADGGAPLAVLMRGRARWEVSLHGVGLSLGSACGLDDWHLDRLARLVERVEPVRVSDHACFGRAPSGAHGGIVHANDLLPLARTAAALDVLATNVQRTQDRLRRPLGVENLSAYLHWAEADMSEAQFLGELCRRTGCWLLLDVNNLVVNALNAGHDPVAVPCRFIDEIAPAHVGQIHLAGYRDLGDIVIDDHGSRVHPPVWQVFAHAVRRLGPRPTLVEWDTALPPLDVLLGEAARAREVMGRCRDGTGAG